MTFSKFANALHPYCNSEPTAGRYVVHITNKIMGGQPGRAHGNDDYQNPMSSKDERTLLAYFNGERSISQTDASMILSKLDKEKFIKYIDKRCSLDAQMLLVKDLREIEDIEIGTKTVPEICADLFESIIYDLAKKPRQKKEN